MIPLEIGQKVILSNGMTGKIAYYNEQNGRLRVTPDKVFEKYMLTQFDVYTDNELYNCQFYLLGKNLYKFKANSIEIMALRDELRRLEERRDCKLDERRDCIRKQLFNLNECMVDDWKKEPKKDISAETALNSSVLNDREKEDKLIGQHPFRLISQI